MRSFINIIYFLVAILAALGASFPSIPGAESAKDCSKLHGPCGFGSACCKPWQCYWGRTGNPLRGVCFENVGPPLVDPRVNEPIQARDVNPIQAPEDVTPKCKSYAGSCDTVNKCCDAMVCFHSFKSLHGTYGDKANSGRCVYPLQVDAANGIPIQGQLFKRVDPPCQEAMTRCENDWDCCQLDCSVPLMGDRHMNTKICNAFGFNRR